MPRSECNHEFFRSEKQRPLSRAAETGRDLAQASGARELPCLIHEFLRAPHFVRDDMLGKFAKFF
ncbi:MAG: hypothetical protein DME69_07175 [Verrucomicrobia bacterium]|nr:MAG: hypothetical protein DME69_07175 [Verrucomicrobiota bacterium]